MNREEALLFIGAAPNASAEETDSILDNKLFELKKEMLEKYMVPALLDKKLKLVEQWSRAEESIRQPKTHSEQPAKALSTQHYTQSDFLQAYEWAASEHKLRISNAHSFNELLIAVKNMILLQESYMILFKQYFNEYTEALPEEVNTREMLDTGSLLRGLKARELSPQMIWSIEKEHARISKIQKLS